VPPKKTQTTAVELARKRRVAWHAFLEFVEKHQSSYWIFRGVADAATHTLVPKIGRNSDFYSH
jgi:hypothetical protein